MTLTIESHAHVRVLRWDDGGDNRVNPDSMAAWHGALDGLETITGPLAIVATGHGKFFSNGLDLDRFQENPDELPETVDLLNRLFGRLLLFPAYTVAAVNGHAFAAGAMLVCGFDARVMREDRGYWCLPEVDLGLALSEQMVAIVRAHVPMAAASEAMLTGRRYTGPEALQAGVVQETAGEEQVLERAVELAAEVGAKDRTVLAVHKKRLYEDVAAICGVDEQPRVG